MADIVNLQQSEYDQTLQQLESMHENALEGIKRIAEQIMELSQWGGDFYVEQLAEKIDMLLSSMEGEILSMMSMNFSASKEAMDNFAEVIRNLDTACNV